MPKYPKPLSSLITLFKKFPGIGTKTAERFAFKMLDWKEEELEEFSHIIGTFKEKITTCSICGCIEDDRLCPFCYDDKRDVSLLCVIATAKEAYAIEETGIYRGLYHVLGHLLSPMTGISSEDLNIQTLKERIEKHQVQEVVIALDSTLEGDTTALFLKQFFEKQGLKVSRIAFGMPMGSTFDYVDEGTLSQAFLGRKSF